MHIGAADPRRRCPETKGGAVISRIAYVNGRYLPYGEAAISIDDRAAQFADGVYEVCPVRDGKILDVERHLARLHYSLSELDIAPPMGDAALRHILREVVRRNRVSWGIVYFQISRGSAMRNHAFPDPPVASSLIVTTRALPRFPNAPGIKVIHVAETRWRRVDIKSTSLLPNVLARQAAVAAGAQEAWFVDDDGLVTEGTASNAWIVTNDNRLITRQCDHNILNGITRQVLMALPGNEKPAIEERPFSMEEAKSAREAFITSASADIVPVIEIDGVEIGDGAPGSLTTALIEALARQENARAEG